MAVCGAGSESVVGGTGAGLWCERSASFRPCACAFAFESAYPLNRKREKVMVTQNLRQMFHFNPPDVVDVAFFSTVGRPL